jgi:hypothetical protein
MTTDTPTVRDALDLAAQYVMFRDRLGLRPAKAKVHAMPWSELLDILRVGADNQRMLVNILEGKAGGTTPAAT